jgi:eukaryotic-like serine/threonine-protein kinase
MSELIIETDALAQDAPSALEQLLRRMGDRSDFPALSDSVGRIQSVVNSESVSLASLSEEILKDVALTNKLLRIVNSARYAHAGGGSVTTVSRAAALIGFSGIRNMALSLVLLEHMQDKGHAKQMQVEFLRALMAGALAEELSSVGRDGEEAFIGAMFLNLGRLLTQYYLPEEARAIRLAIGEATGAPGHDDAQAEDAASRKVLGLSFEEFGLGVAKAWGLPPALLSCMQRPTGDPPPKLLEKSADRVHWLALAGSEMTDALLDPDPQASRVRLADVAKRYRRALGRDAEEFETAALGARQRVTDMAQAMNLHLDVNSPAQRLLLEPPMPDAEVPGAAPVPTASALNHGGVPARPNAKDAKDAKGSKAEAVMSAGIQSVTNLLVEDFQLDDVLRHILEVMQRALDFRRVLLCLRDARGETLVGRLGVGANPGTGVAGFKVALNSNNDLFSVVCNKGVDTLISDATLPNIAQRLPAWYRSSLNAPAFLLLPLQLKAKPLGLIYADKGRPGAIELAESELALLRTLRNQAVMAFRQST